MLCAVCRSTSASLVAREAGFQVIEFNASDVRNKAALENVVGPLVRNHGMAEYWVAQGSAFPRGGKRTVIIMDEVDGISGNEDRGGLQTLTQLIKRARVPIICIANDASTQKMKTVKSYTLHMVWRRPTADQIIPRLTAIAHAEGLDVDTNAMRKLVESTQADIRQTINFLQMYKKTHRSLAYDGVLQGMAGGGKDFDTGAFDVIQAFFRDSGKRAGWIDERSNLYFVDGSLVPLFIQEMYLKGKPRIDASKGPRQAEAQVMEVASLAADYIADADTLSSIIYSEQEHSLMPVHAVLSSVAPGYLMSASGSAGFAQFPTWLGQNSSRTKRSRLIREMHTAASLSAPSSVSAFTTEYLPALRTHLVDPFHGPDPGAAVDAVIDELDSLGLTKEDWDSLVEVTDPFATLGDKTKLESATKSRFTREWNKREHRVTATRGVKGERVAASAGPTIKVAADELEEEDEDAAVEAVDEEEDEDDDSTAAKGDSPEAEAVAQARAAERVKKDPMIKAEPGTSKETAAQDGKGAKGGRGGATRGARGGARGGRGGAGKGGRGAGRSGARGGRGGAAARRKGRKDSSEDEDEDDNEDMAAFIVDDDDVDDL